MITKFKIYEKLNIGIKDTKPEKGDYVITTLDYIIDEGDQAPGIDIIRKCRNYIENNIGQISHYSSDTVFITYENLPVDGNFIPNEDVAFDIKYIIYWSKNKKDLEPIIAAKKYNL